MKTYHVRVAVRVLEIWEVEAENAEDAMATWDDGKLIHTSDEALDTETLSAKEESPCPSPASATQEIPNDQDRSTSKPLPPDPEGMNENRATWAGSAIARFMLVTGTDQEDALSDLLADLHHWADRNNYDFAAALDRARGHYSAETLGEIMA